MVCPPRPLTRGTTLIELLFATVFLGICAAAILNTATGARTSATYAMRRAAVLALAEDEINDSRQIARSAALLGPGALPETRTRTVAIPGLPGVVTVTRYTVTGSPSNMYNVTATGSWQEPIGSGSRAESITLRTVVRAPNND